MSRTSRRIVSLLPSTTEIVCALGLKKQLVGRSHECDFPAGIDDLPSCTEPKFRSDGSSYEIDQRVKNLLQEGLSVYRVDAEQLAALKPDVILTQDHCEVCAATLPEVKKAVGSTLGYSPEIVSVSPTSLDSVFESIRTIAEAVEAESAGFALIKRMRKDFRDISCVTQNLKTKPLLCLEWLDPLMTAGNWVPDLVEIAGGKALGASPGEHSPWYSWEQLLKEDPPAIAIMPCGYSIDQTLKEVDRLAGHTGWEQLKAVGNDEVYLLDGNQYFNRPGPRLGDSARILAEILHPGTFEASHSSSGWKKLSQHHQTANR